MKRSVRVGLCVGLVVGVALPLVALGVGVTHVVCNQGSALGWGGRLLATPLNVAVPPPGGFVNYSVTVSMNGSEVQTYFSPLPSNASVASWLSYNWTAYSETASTTPGWGPAPKCPAYALAPGALYGGGNCFLAAPTPAGIDERSAIPDDLNSCGSPSALINATYGASPISNFDWVNTSQGEQFSVPTGPGSYQLTAGPFFEHQQLYGFGVSVRLSSIQFGLPIPVRSGGVEDFAASLPEDVPGLSLQGSLTYVFPAATDQGSWDVYLAGPGSPYSVGGLLFEQTAGPP
jgi:hypothetical protein